MLPTVVSGLLALILLTACERRDFEQDRDTTPVVAQVEGSLLTKREFDNFLPEDYENVLTQQEVRDYLDRWITTELLYKEAMRTGRGVPDDLETRIERYRKELVADQLVQQIIRDRAFVSDAEVMAYYEAHETEYTKEYRVSHILVNTREDAEDIRNQLGKRSFTYLARRYSIDKHSGSGGDLGYLSKGNMIPEFEDVVFGMAVGDVSEIIESEFGYHLVTVTDVRDARYTLAFEDIRSEIANMLALARRDAVYDSLIAALRSGANVQIMDSALEFLPDEPDTFAVMTEEPQE